MGPLTGKAVIITGAGRGIGLAIAKAYAAQAGASVCVADRTWDEIYAAAGSINQAGGQAFAFQVDVRSEAGVIDMTQKTVERFGGLDILVINAGVDLDPHPVENSQSSLWLETIATNLTGAYYCAKAAIPFLRRRRSGKIIMIGSGLGHHGQPASSAYACSKAGLWMLARVLAQELEQSNISVNELIPGPVTTSGSSEDPQNQISTRYPSEWQKQPEDVVPLALFLAAQPDRGPTAQSFSLIRRDNS